MHTFNNQASIGINNTTWTEINFAANVTNVAVFNDDAVTNLLVSFDGGTKTHHFLFGEEAFSFINKSCNRIWLKSGSLATGHTYRVITW